MGNTIEKKFSVLSYAHQLTEERVRLDLTDEKLHAIIRHMREMLVNPKNISFIDEAEYNQTLHEAVLGFPHARKRVISIISQELIKQYWHDYEIGNTAYENFAEALFAEVIGLGVLELILKQKDGLEEIQVVGTQIFEVRNGFCFRSKYSFQTTEEVERIQRNLVLFNQDAFSRVKRWAEVNLHNGARVTLTGFGFTANPTITIRLFNEKTFSLEQLTASRLGTINHRILLLLQVILEARLNLVLIGPTNSGKSHLMKSLISALPDEQRIITIEGRFELMLSRDFPKKNIIEYEAAADEDNHDPSLAFKLALRQTPERIIHAEIRDSDANIYVRACTRGHRGSMTTVHVNELEDVPEAIADMCMLDERTMDVSRLVSRITTNVTQIGIEMAIVDGQRKVVRISEFLLDEVGHVRLNDLVRFNYAKRTWDYPNLFSENRMQHILKYTGYSEEKLTKCLRGSSL